MMTLPVNTRAAQTAKSFALTSAVACGAMLLSVGAQAAETTMPIDLAGSSATKHEIALLQVLSEICPPMLQNTTQRSRFYKTYNYELHQLLPTIDNPKAAIQYLSTQEDYKSILESMRSWTMGYNHDDNLALCTELASTEI